VAAASQLLVNMASSALLTASAALKSRVRRPSLLNKLAHPEDLIPLFPNGAYIGWSGFTGVGYPKYVSIAQCFWNFCGLSECGAFAKEETMLMYW